MRARLPRAPAAEGPPAACAPAMGDDASPESSQPGTPRSDEGEQCDESWRCCPVNGYPVGIRPRPEYDAPMDGQVVLPGEVFKVQEVVLRTSGALFLKLADGRGWVFASKPGVGKMCAKVIGDPELEKFAAWTVTTVNGQPLGIRELPDVNAALTGEVLWPNEVFRVKATKQTYIKGAGCLLFLELADGRGWVFDRKPGVGVMCSPTDRRGSAGASVVEEEQGDRQEASREALDRLDMLCRSMVDAPHATSPQKAVDLEEPFGTKIVM